MEIGHFGKKIVFATSDKKILTFNAFTQTVYGNWGIHKVIHAKPKKEFTGPGARKVTFRMAIDATLGVRPRKTLEALEAAVEKGAAEYLVIGGKAIGKNKFVITEMSEAWGTIYSRGELARAEVSVTMEEYR